MYQDLIRGELTEAAETLSRFLQDEANIEAIQKAAVLLADSLKRVAKYYLAVMVVLIVTQCILPKS